MELTTLENRFGKRLEGFREGMLERVKELEEGLGLTDEDQKTAHRVRTWERCKDQLTQMKEYQSDLTSTMGELESLLGEFKDHAAFIILMLTKMENLIGVLELKPLVKE